MSSSCNIDQHKCFENYEDVHDENHVVREIPRCSNYKNSEITSKNILHRIYKLWILSRNRPYSIFQHQVIRRRIIKLYLLYTIIKKRNRQRHKRQYWVRPIFSEERRLMQGASDNLVREMENLDKDKYFNYFRMSFETFEQLLSTIEPDITKKIVVRTPISARTRLQVTLRYLASGDSMVSISYAFRIAHNTISKIVPETCAAIWNSLKATVFPQPSTTNWLNIAENFENICHFNNCIGACDGKHVVIQAPPNSGSTYYNYKGQHSLILLGICDANSCFIVVDIGGEGRQCDSTIFQNSEVNKRFCNGSLEIPAAKYVMNSIIKLPYVLVADEAFPLTTFIMRPYPRKNLDMRKKVFNYRLSYARRSIECAFGILAARWRIYGKPIIASLPTVRKIIQATVVLHNFVMSTERNLHVTQKQYSNFSTQDRAVISNGMRNISINRSSNPVEAKKIREDFADFFNDIGALPWQWDKVINNDF
ncbi:PREDICTED: uncharacterized protein LOC105570326 isoform X2 [Vollenhovia emeryi]|nr:PREDICTED: uncharacterized protein LOC105570326 isoform X2 [Vollenhovia emeryi]